MVAGALANFKWITILVGVVVLILGGLGLAGVVTLPAAVGCTPGSFGCSGAGLITPSFTATLTNLTVTLTDMSAVALAAAHLTGTLSVTILWADGTSSHGQIGAIFPHTYKSAGTYNVTDIVAGKACGGTPLHCGFVTGQLTRLLTITATTFGCGSLGKPGCQNPPPPGSITAAFSFAATGLSVTFADHSTVSHANVTSVTWKFGDGVSATGALGGSVSHTYTASGTYNVTELIVASLNGTLPPPATQVQGSTSQFVNVTTQMSNITNTGTSVTSGGPSSAGLNSTAIALAALGVVLIAGTFLVFGRPTGVALVWVAGIVVAIIAFVAAPWL
jgi:PKD repeat protein